MTKPVCASKPSRATVVVRASAESRRAVLSGFVAAGAALVAKSAFAAASPVDLKDDRTARDRGFDLIYEARDLDLPQSTRDGMTQARTDLETTKSRAKLSEARIDADLEPVIKKNYWTEAREQLRRQVGTLRFDLNVLATAKPGKADKKKALELRKEFIRSVEDLDFSLRQKDEASSLEKLEKTKSSLDAVLAFVL